MTDAEISPNVLLVEDDAFVREITKLQLVKLGFRVFEAESAEVAIEILESFDGSFAGILSDFRMPGSMQGDELLLRAGGFFPGVHCVLMTGQIEGEGMPAPALKKPFTHEELAQAMAPVLPR